MYNQSWGINRKGQVIWLMKSDNKAANCAHAIQGGSSRPRRKHENASGRLRN